MANKYLDDNGLLYFWQKIKNMFVAQESGKGLSTNDYTTTEKNKLAGIESGAEVNVIETVKKNGTALTVTGKAVDVIVPTNTSDLTNDSGFITSASVPTASTSNPVMDGTAAVGTSTAYARADHVHPKDTSKADIASPTFTGEPKAPTASAGTNTTQIATTAFVKTAVDTAIAGVSSFSYEVVESLPATGENGVIYLVAHSHGTQDIYDEYIWTGSTYEKIGSTDVDLSNYLTEVAYDSTNAKITKTKNGVTSDVVTVATIKSAMNLSKSDIGLGNVDNTADANKAVLSATKLATARTIDGVDFDGQSAITHYGTCSTAAATNAKTVALTGFALVTGSRIAVKFIHGHTASTMTLNVNSTGAKNAVRTANGTVYRVPEIMEGQVVEFVYEGTMWVCVGFAYGQITDVYISAGSVTDGMVISPKTLVDNFASVAITNTEIDTIVAS